ncbi:NAD(P)/FAD-dependent oxidoreductase [bacterium]|nr:NAD(P)/FAD-dependent oxidoreductase [bacterium]
MAAGQACGESSKVIILEKMKFPGRKLRITGKGRCNLTNNASVKAFIEQFKSDGRFLFSAFHRFFNQDLIEFFDEIGVTCKTERGGRVFPESDKAQDVVDALVEYNRNNDVKIIKNVKVESLEIKEGRIIGVTGIRSGGKGKNEKVTYPADSVIICCGGASYPRTGSTGDGYRLAKNAGHEIIPVRPSLVPLKYKDNVLKKLNGLILKNVKVQVWMDGNSVREEFGEASFIDDRISGPVILKMSRFIVDSLDLKKKIFISIDLKPALKEEKLLRRLERECTQFSDEKIDKILRKLMPSNLIGTCLAYTGLSSELDVSSLNSVKINCLLKWLKDFRFEISGYGSFDEAIITAGGVSTKQIDPRTMESKIVKDLYFAGEILDIDANTGGYNLQAAFSTGWLAGRSAGGIYY